MKKKIRLGKQTKDGYQYHATGNLGPGLTTQIEGFVKEKEVKDLLKKKVDKLNKITQSFKDQEKKNNIIYYHKIGKNLGFLEKTAFKRVAPGSVFRLVYEWLPGLLPHISSPKNAHRHVEIMYYLGRADMKDLRRATWWQWYDIAKFPKLFTDKKHYKKILEMLRDKKGSVRTLVPKRFRN